MGQVEYRCIHALRQAEIVGVKQCGLAVLALTGLALKRAARFQIRALSRVGMNTSTRVGAWSSGRRAHTEVDHVLQQQPATGELASSRLIPERQQGMAEISHHGGGQESDGVSQAQAQSLAQ